VYFCVWNTKVLKTFVDNLKKQGLTVKVLEKLMVYLSCSIKFSQDRKSTWVGQPHLIPKLQEKFLDVWSTRCKAIAFQEAPGRGLSKSKKTG